MLHFLSIIERSLSSAIVYYRNECVHNILILKEIVNWLFLIVNIMAWYVQYRYSDKVLHKTQKLAQCHISSVY